ncbi:hypothetical protein [Azospirillum sp. ST 5-10]|uniref:hypothetical protein n=1 Tax=unclassified Azospirillum TaxID=2630922 RepID=UPI003F4A12A4
MRKALPTLFAFTALTFGSLAAPAFAADDDAAAATPSAAENPAPVQESWMAGPQKAEPSTGEDPSSAEAVDESDVDDSATDDPKLIEPDSLARGGDGRWIDPDADIATAPPEELGVKEHKVEIYKPLGNAPPAALLDAK